MTANNHAFQLHTIPGLSPLVQSYLETTPQQEAMATFETLSPLAQSRALLYASQIDLANFESLLSLGHDSQRALSQFADRMLAQVKQKDVTKIGQMLDSLMQTLDRVDPAALEPKKQSFLKKSLVKQSPLSNKP